MKKLVFLSLLTLSFQPCHAALSGYYQGLKELREVLDNPYLIENLSQGYPIEEVKMVETTDTYRMYAVSSNGKTVLAKLNYVKTRLCGPRPYEIEWTTLTE